MNLAKNQMIGAGDMEIHLPLWKELMGSLTIHFFFQASRAAGSQQIPGVASVLWQWH